MTVRAHPISHRSAKDLRERHVGDFADNVPQREVDARDGRGPHDAVPMPEMLPIHHLPQIFHPRRILADEQVRHVLNGPHDAARVPLERRLPPANESRLVGDDFDKNPVSHPGMADEGFDGCDLHVRSIAFLGCVMEALWCVDLMKHRLESLCHKLGKVLLHPSLISPAPAIYRRYAGTCGARSCGRRLSFGSR